MTIGSPESGKYVVYTVSDESSNDTDDGHINLQDPETISLRGKQSPNLRRIRSFSSDSSKWSSYWSNREKCCCLWNIAFLFAITGLVITIVYITVEGTDRNIKEGNDTRNPSESIGVTTENSGEIKPPINQICTTQECVQLAAEILSRMNKSVDPCENFYEYACGGYKPPLSWLRPRIREVPDAVRMSYKSHMIDQLSKSVRTSDSPGVEVAKKTFQSCLSTSKEEIHKHFEELIVSLDKKNIDSSDVQDDSLTYLLAHSVKFYGVSALFKVIVMNGGKIAVLNRYSDARVEVLSSLGYHVSSFRHLQPSSYYYKDWAITKYKTFAKNAILSLLGSGNESFPVSFLLSTLDDVIDLEIRLNKAMYDSTATSSFNAISRCTQKSTVSELKRSASEYKIDWSYFLRILLERNVTNDLEICFSDLSYNVADILFDTSINIIKSFIKFHIILNSDIITSATLFVTPFKSVDDDFTQSENSAEAKCFNSVENLFPLAILFSSLKDKYFEGNATRVFEKLRSALFDTIDDMYWIPITQRNSFIKYSNKAKLKFTVNIDKKVDISVTYLPLKRNTGYFRNVFGAMRVKYDLEIKGVQLLSPFRKTSAYFDEYKKHIILSSIANQQPIFYDTKSSAFLFGSTGAFIAQLLAKVFDIDVILSHFMDGFIDQGVVLTFAHHLQCLVDTYKQYTLSTESGVILKVRGDLTKNDNFRDMLALKITHRAYKEAKERTDSPRLPGLNVNEHQLFFILYTQTFCEQIHSRGVDKFYVSNDQHILPRNIRITGILSNFLEFTRAFQCPLGSVMSPSIKCLLF